MASFFHFAEILIDLTLASSLKLWTMIPSISFFQRPRTSMLSSLPRFRSFFVNLSHLAVIKRFYSFLLRRTASLFDSNVFREKWPACSPDLRSLFHLSRLSWAFILLIRCIAFRMSMFHRLYTSFLLNFGRPSTSPVSLMISSCGPSTDIFWTCCASFWTPATLSLPYVFLRKVYRSESSPSWTTTGSKSAIGTLYLF